MKLQPLAAVGRTYPFLEHFVDEELAVPLEQCAGGEMVDLEIKNHGDIRRFVATHRQDADVYYLDSEGWVLAWMPARQAIQPPRRGVFVHGWQERVTYVVFVHPESSEVGKCAYLQIHEVCLRMHTATFGGVVYDMDILIELAEALPEEVVSIDIFAKFRWLPCWTEPTGRRISPNDILKVAAKYGGNWQAMLFANLDWAQHTTGVRDASYERYPILVTGECEVVDGMHRLTRAWWDEATTIKIKRFPALPAEAVLTRNSPSSI